MRLRSRVAIAGKHTASGGQAERAESESWTLPARPKAGAGPDREAPQRRPRQSPLVSPTAAENVSTYGRDPVTGLADTLERFRLRKSQGSYDDDTRAGHPLRNTAAGFAAMYSNTTGSGNSAFGYLALEVNTSGDLNTALGKGAAYANTTGYQNTVVGASALLNNV